MRANVLKCARQMISFLFLETNYSSHCGADNWTTISYHQLLRSRWQHQQTIRKFSIIWKPARGRVMEKVMGL